jgi:hypothetical protein
MKNGLLSGGLNPGPLGHESSALPLDHGYSPNQADSCSVLRHLLVQVSVFPLSSRVVQGFFVTRANLCHRVFECSVLRHVSHPGRSTLLVQCLIIRGYCQAVPSKHLVELLIRQILCSVLRHLLVQTSYVQKDH